MIIYVTFDKTHQHVIKTFKRYDQNRTKSRTVHINHKYVLVINSYVEDVKYIENLIDVNFHGNIKSWHHEWEWNDEWIVHYHKGYFEIEDNEAWTASDMSKGSGWAEKLYSPEKRRAYQR